VGLEDFLASPWKKSHARYENAVFNIRPAPEFSTAEILVASLYRASGFHEYSENEVPRAGREFDKTTKGSKDEPGRIRLDTWRTVLHGVLESPKQRQQSSKRFLQMCPVVPDIALYSGSPRLAGSSWNPGVLVQRMIQMGSPSLAVAKDTWHRLFEALSVGSTDDLWARWLQEEFQLRGKGDHTWSETDLDSGPDLPAANKVHLQFPAQQFVRDLDAVILAKARMTRRQWISILESILRLGAATHVLWLCSVNGKLWNRAKEILNGQSPAPTVEEVRSGLVNGERRYLAYGNPASAFFKQYASDYLVARLGLNLVLWLLNDESDTVGSLESCEDLQQFFLDLERHRKRLVDRGIWRYYSELTESEAKTIGCKKGVGSNLVEFIGHTLRQRDPAAKTSRGYDQGYVLRKRGQAEKGPLVVSLGPVAVLALVHSCLKEAAGPRSVRKLCEHLAAYGVDVDLDDIANSELGKNLRMLGLVLDSPDAESGMLLVPPF
jgi:hypothetical protein